MTPEQEREKLAAEERIKRENYAEEKANAIMNAEANRFALELLMPRKFILDDIADGIDLANDAAVEKLAKKYRVSVPIIALRIVQISTSQKRG